MKGNYADLQRQAILQKRTVGKDLVTTEKEERDDDCRIVAFLQKGRKLL